MWKKTRGRNTIAVDIDGTILCIIIVIIIIGHLNRRRGSWRHEPRTLIDAEARAGRRHMVILRACIGNDDDDNNNNCTVIDISFIFYNVRAVIIYYTLDDSIRSFRFEFVSLPTTATGLRLHLSVAPATCSLTSKSSPGTIISNSLNILYTCVVWLYKLISYNKLTIIILTSFPPILAETLWPTVLFKWVL